MYDKIKLCYFSKRSATIMKITEFFMWVLNIIGGLIGLLILIIMVRFYWSVPNILESIEDELIRIRKKLDSSNDKKSHQ